MWGAKDYATGIQQSWIAFASPWRHDIMATPTCVHPTLEELLPVFRSCFTRATIRQVLAQSAPTTTF